ncbi:hypothetical protein [Rhodoferax sp.]|uniref:hypothetical protein n=1 Tax=Rhodoferax sp. TaxID=50421 RepID=UPI002ACE932E|nr:hypothetical protein [Rhodoferax sp.]MDZ7921077.1 hypothetical protein [Rhodoferax sp.]
MELAAIRRFSYLVPAAAVAGLGAYTTISWWALAMVLGGVMFAWDWLWGDAHLLQAGVGGWFIAAGVAGLLVSYLLAQRLGLGVAEFLALASGAARRERWLYNLPALAVGSMVYGGLILSKADC